MYKLIILIIAVVMMTACESQSGRRRHVEPRTTVQVLNDMPKEMYLVHAVAYLNDSIIAQKDYVVYNTREYADSVCTKKANDITGYVLCDSISMHISPVELVK